MAEKKIELRKVPCGETFTAFGEEFVVLDHVDGGVLSLRKSIWKDAPFDTDANNNLSEASMLHTLGEYVRLLKSNGANDDAFLPLTIDLKATDGTRAYGYLTGSDVGLLTLEQYGKYKDIIPLVDDWWWLATPWSTRWLRSPNTYSSALAWLVYTNGDCGDSYCSNSYGVRPALNFVPCLLVAWGDDDGEAEQDGQAKKEAWDAYHEYLCDWMEENNGESHYGNSPLSFEEWMEDLYEPGGDEE